MLQAFALGPWGGLDVHRPGVLCLRRQTPARIRRNKKLMPMLPEEKDLEEWFQPMEPHTDTHTNPSTRRKKDLWAQYHERANAEIDKRLDLSADRRAEQLRLHDTTGFWYCWCSAIEEGHIAARQLTRDQAKKVRGRGRIQIESVDAHTRYAEYRAEDDRKVWDQNQLHEAPATQRESGVVRHLSNLAKQH